MNVDPMPLPPGETTPVRARRVLALAPHFDDEVLGCGGLLAQLARQGAAVRVLFLSDGAGLPDADRATRVAYSERRSAEAARALEVLGLSGAERLGLPDGALVRNLGSLEEGIRKHLLGHRPDLLLVPSPLEVTPDHRAAFAALHRILGPLRPPANAGVTPASEGGSLLELARGLTVLAYEVNHPGYPDLLVDVSGELDLLDEAMACYASQEEQHAYAAAGRGLRRYRALSLAAPSTTDGESSEESTVTAAEAYRRLTLTDFTTRSPAQLVRWLGGAPERLVVEEGPRVSVVVRTKDRPALLAEALESLAEGHYRRAEVVVVNDGGAPPELPEDFPLPLRRVDLETSRGRSAAANAGVEAATGDWIAFLDDDDRAAPEHLATLADAARGSGVRVVYSDAAVVTLELTSAGSGPGHGAAGWQEVERRLPYSRDFDPSLLLVDNYIPFNTLLMERSLVLETGELREDRGEPGPFDPALPLFEDWDFLLRLATLAPFHHLRRVTAEYRHFRGSGHHVLGDQASRRSDALEWKAKVLERHAHRLSPDRLAAAVDTLRREAVDLGDLLGVARRDLTKVHRAYGDLEERHYALNGEAVGLREELAQTRRDNESQGRELERLFGEEARLREVVADQTAHLGRTYGEIERLNGLLEALRRASLPGLLQWWRDQRRAAGGPGDRGGEGGAS